jgi:general stress protein CsbA
MIFIVGIIAAFITLCVMIFASAFFGLIGPYEMIGMVVIATIVGILVARRWDGRRKVSA